MAEATLRIDKFLWFARFTKSRPAAQALAEQGHLRIDGRAVDRAHAPVRAGQVLSFMAGGRVRVIRVLALPARRGPAAEARLLYREMTADVDDGGQAQLAGPAAASGGGLQ